MLSRDRHGLLALFVMPMVFIIIMSLALKDIYAPPISSLAYALDQRDDSPAATLFAKEWAAKRGVPQKLPDDWQGELRSAHLRYVLVIDPGFGAALTGMEAPTAARLHLIAEPGLNASLYQGLEAELQGRIGEMRAVAIQKQVFGFAQENAQSLRRLMSAGRLGGNVVTPSAVQQNVPAWLVFGMFFVVMTIAGLFVQEQRDGTLARLVAMGVPHAIQIAAKALPYLLVNALQAALMLAVGVYLMPLLGGDPLSLGGVNGPALGLMLFSISLAAVGFALALASLSRTHAQASLLGPMCNLLMAAIGGIMVPTFIMPSAMQSIAVYSPMNWGLEGLLTILLRQGDVVAVLPHAARLLVFSLCMFILAALLFSRRARR